MVAITVVLAAVLYLLVSGLIGGGGTTEPNINLSNGSGTGITNEYKVEVAGASTGETLASYKVALLNGTVLDVDAIALDTLGTGTCTPPGTKGEAQMTFTDVQVDGKLNQGDWFIVCGTDTTSDYQVQLFWKSSGNKISGNTGIIQQ